MYVICNIYIATYEDRTKAKFLLLQYMGSFPVAIPDIDNRAEYVRSQLETLRVSTLSNSILLSTTSHFANEIDPVSSIKLAIRVDADCSRGDHGRYTKGPIIPARLVA